MQVVCWLLKVWHVRPPGGVASRRRNARRYARSAITLTPCVIVLMHFKQHLNFSSIFGVRFIVFHSFPLSRPTPELLRNNFPLGFHGDNLKIISYTYLQITAAKYTDVYTFHGTISRRLCIEHRPLRLVISSHKNVP